ASPEKALLVETMPQLVALRKRPGEGHEHPFRIASQETNAHQLVTGVESPIDVTEDIRESDRLLVQRDLERPVRKGGGFRQQRLKIREARHARLLELDSIGGRKREKEDAETRTFSLHPENVRVPFVLVPHNGGNNFSTVSCAPACPSNSRNGSGIGD